MATRSLFLFLVSLVFLNGCKEDNPEKDEGKSSTIEVLTPKDVVKTNAMGLWAHYMPWFEDKASSGDGNWGSHWTMANKNPDLIDANGKRQIAAHYYPLIGPYASNDRDVLEYHFLLMKYAGIDGVWIDWYGTRNLYDYALNKRNTEVIVDVLKKVGLKYAIVYEDQTLRDQFDTDGQRIVQAVADMRYLQTNFFKDDNYFKQDGKPVLLTFGPQVLTSPSMWSTVLGSLQTRPLFYTLYNHSDRAANASNPNINGEFIWVDSTPMETKYARRDAVGTMFGGAYPGFQDFYKEGGWGEQVLAPIAHENGLLLKNLLDMARTEQADHVQLITWNDFGEGTMIEPTSEFGFGFLETIQDFAGVSYEKRNLEYILTYYNLKKQFANNPEKKKKLLQAFYYYIALEQEKAEQIINELK